MTDNEIYRLWLSKTKDPRYLKKLRWDEIRKVIDKYKVRKVLEFGSGISTLLFCNLGLTVHSYETSQDFIKFVKSICPRAKYHLWDGVSAEISDNFDLSLVDGALPRENQLVLAMKSSKIVAVDDFGGKAERHLGAMLSEWQRIDSGKTLTAIFYDNTHI